MTGTLLTTIEVAERLGLSSAAVAQAVRMGALQPTARTADEMLFSERAVAAFAERRAAAAASPLQPPARGSRTEWAGDLDRLNSWLKEVNESMPATAAAPPPKPAAPPAPVPAAPPAAAPPLLPELDFRPPPLTEREMVVKPPEPPPSPVAAEPEPEPEPAPVPEPVPEPAPEPVPVAHEPILPTAAEATVPLAEPVAALKSGLSRQAVLVVEPIERFRILRDVADRLATVSGLADARLERLEGGLASYRLSFGDARPSGEAIASALAPLGLQVMLVDSPE